LNCDIEFKQHLTPPLAANVHPEDLKVLGRNLKLPEMEKSGSQVRKKQVMLEAALSSGNADGHAICQF
jgi:hypothetical protein